MSTQNVLTTNARLLEISERIAKEFDQVAAGSVLRCLSRAVLLARRSGVPLESLPHVAEDVAQRMLVRRGQLRCESAAR